MALHHVGNAPEFLEEYGLPELPKGDMLRLSMNPHNGKVFLSLEKHPSSSLIALGLMRSILRRCDELERLGSADPLRDYIAVCDGDSILFGASDGAIGKEKRFSAYKGDLDDVKGVGAGVRDGISHARKRAS